MKKFFVALAAFLFAANVFAQIPNSGGGNPGIPNGGAGPNGYGGGGVQLNASMFDFVGDSRTTNINTGGANYFPGSGVGTTANSWFNQANALANNRYVLGLQLGGSSCRSDQDLSIATITPALNSQALWFVIGPYGVNDIAPLTGTSPQSGNSCPNVGGSFPYTNTLGQSVTQTTVGAIAAQNVINAANLALQAGKNVIIIAENGAQNTTQASIGQMYDANARLKAYAAGYPGRVYYIDFASVLYAPTSSATQVTYKTNYSLDGTHLGPLGAFAAAGVFNAAIQPLVPYVDNQIASINNVNATNARQLVQNPLFTTTTGGTGPTGCNAGSTGSVPSGWTFNCSTTNITIAITSAAEANGFGNAITVAATCSASGTVTLQNNAPTLSLWNLTDYLQFKATIAVAAGSSNFAVYGTADVNTDLGTFNHWMLQNGSAAFGPGPTTAYTYTIATTPGGPLAGSVTKNFTVSKIMLYCSAAGNGTATISRVEYDRLYLWNGSTLTGQ